MWLFTEDGFISAVATKPGSGLLRVRARDRQSLEDIAASFSLAIEKSPDRDYPYRVEVTNAQFSSWVARKAEEIQYPNFKSRVYETRGSRFSHALSSVWSTMHEVEDGEARSH